MSQGQPAFTLGPSRAWHILVWGALESESQPHSPHQRAWQV